MASSPVRKSTAQSNTSNRSSGVSSPAKNPNPTTTTTTTTTTAAKRLSNMNPTRSNSVNTHGSADELERERAKVSSLKALITAAEEKEADATAEAANWRSKADQLSSTIDRMEAELAEAQELKTNYERLTKELEKLKAAHKELERTQFRQVGLHFFFFFFFNR
jgi:DNA repair exonuclease SbcCD ATPase subunit